MPDLLHTTRVLQAGETLEDADLMLADNFVPDSTNCAIRIAGNDVVIRNVRLFGYRELPGWGVPLQNLAGIRAVDVKDVRIADVTVDGFPNAAIKGFGWNHWTIEDVLVHHCYGGVHCGSHPLGATSAHNLLRRLTVTDSWSGPPEPGNMVAESIARPGGWMGGDCFALHSWHHSTIDQCYAVGETRPGKISNPLYTVVQRCRLPGLMVQGKEGVTGNADIYFNVFDKGLAPDAEHNCIQIAAMSGRLHVELRRNLLNAAGQNGHGIRCIGATLLARNNIITGFNGSVGRQPGTLAYALRLSDGGVADSFKLSNEFPRQERILLAQ